MRRDFIERAWGYYRAAAVQSGASEVMVRHLRYAFFAGFAALFIAIEDTPEGQDDAKTADWIEGLREELSEHTKEVRHDGEDAAVLSVVVRLFNDDVVATLSAIAERVSLDVSAVQSALARLEGRRLVRSGYRRYLSETHWWPTRPELPN